MANDFLRWIAELSRFAGILNFSEDQPRNEKGEWSEAGGSGTNKPESANSPRSKKLAEPPSIKENETTTRTDRASGALIVERHFTVQRPGHEAHRVDVEVSHSGAPQHEHCDCAGYRFRRECAHINAVYEGGVLGVGGDG